VVRQSSRLQLPGGEYNNVTCRDVTRGSPCAWLQCCAVHLGANLSELEA
jgi:hypothetical protein